jgi:hypothetical protein
MIMKGKYSNLKALLIVEINNMSPDSAETWTHIKIGISISIYSVKKCVANELMRNIFIRIGFMGWDRFFGDKYLSFMNQKIAILSLWYFYFTIIRWNSFTLIKNMILNVVSFIHYLMDCLLIPHWTRNFILYFFLWGFLYETPYFLSRRVVTLTKLM